MNGARFLSWPRALGAGALLGIVFLRWGTGGGEAPDAGLLSPVYVPPAEWLDTRALRPGQTLGEILAAASVAATEINSLLLAFREHANPRALRPGAEVTVRRASRDGELRAIDVRLNPDSTVRLSRDEFGWSSAIVETPVWVDTIYGSGRILEDDNLWFALGRDPALAGLPPEDVAYIIDALDRIYQWRVDFSRQIQPGDYYRLAFRREVRPDGSMRAGHIVAAELYNGGKSIAAIRFDPDGDGSADYYDYEGKSLRGAFLKKPLEFRRISSVFTRGRKHPILGVWRAHRGVDYAASSGTPVYATGSGTVTFRGWKGGYGNLVEVRHAGGFVTRYGHLRSFAVGVRVGRRVSQGQTIGYVGMTGLATGPHLHYEMLNNGHAVNPLGVNIPAGEPIPEAARERWVAARATQWGLLAERVPPPVYLASTGEGARDERPRGGS